MKFLKNGTGLLVLVLFALVAFSPIRAQDAKPSEKPQAPAEKKEPKKRIEDALGRAMRRARKVDDQRFMRATVLPSEMDDEAAFLVVCEFGTGDWAVFHGGKEPEEDQWTFMTKDHALVIEEIVHRQARR